MCQKKYDLVIISLAFYPNLKAQRVECARKTCAAAHELAITSKDISIHMVIVNDKESHSDIKSELQRHGGESVTIVEQKKPGMKGVALREAISFAQNICKTSGAISFLELEKIDFISHTKKCATPILRNEADIVIPRRKDQHFASTYAKEQYHSETFGNMYVNNLLNRHGDDFLDIYFGPFLFSRKLANLWLTYEGTLWDAQIVPYLRAMQSNLYPELRVFSVPVDYRHDENQKEEEEGSVEYCQKRLLQLFNIVPLLHEILSPSTFKPLS